MLFHRINHLHQTLFVYVVAVDDLLFFSQGWDFDGLKADAELLVVYCVDC